MAEAGDLERIHLVDPHPALHGGGLPDFAEAGCHGHGDLVPGPSIVEFVARVGQVERHVLFARGRLRLMGAVQDVPRVVVAEPLMRCGIAQEPVFGALVIEEHTELVVVAMLAVPGLLPHAEAAAESGESVFRLEENHARPCEEDVPAGGIVGSDVELIAA